MCLFIDKRRNRELKNRFKTCDYIMCYKIIERILIPPHPTILIGIWRSMYQYQIGWNYSDREDITLTKIEIDDKAIRHGIHVYTSKKTAKHNVNISGSPFHFKIIPVKCHKRDFVAAGKHGEAVFCKIFISKKDYQDAIIGK